MSTAVPTTHLGIIQGRPSTFAERGVCVPFTTPILAQARIGMDRYEQLECLLPGFSGGKGTYVFSWKTVPEVIKITLHDRALHKEILEVGANSPDTIRTCALTIAARGFAGLAAAHQAKQALALDQQYVVLTNYVFVLELLKLVGVSTPDLLKTGLGTEEARQTAKNALNQVAENFRIAPDVLYGRVEELSLQLAPVGLPQAPRPGRLRSLVDRLRTFEKSVLDWGAVETTEASGLASFIADCAQQTVGLAETKLSRLDKLLKKTRDVVVGNNKVSAEVDSTVTALSWLLDGWEYICQLWEDSRDQSEDMQRIAICEVFRIAPVIPSEELAANETFDMEDMKRVQRRWVRGNQDWRTGGMDYDAVRRIEQLKAKVA